MDKQMINFLMRYRGELRGWLDMGMSSHYTNIPHNCKNNKKTKKVKRNAKNTR